MRIILASESQSRKVQDAVVVSSDAVVAKNGTVFEKPRAIAEAAQFLREVSGSTFKFVTSLSVVRSDTRRMLSTVETTEIRFRDLIKHEICDYVSRDPVLNFAGAFEGDGVLRFADSVSGSYNFIAAFPASPAGRISESAGSRSVAGLNRNVPRYRSAEWCRMQK